MQDADAPGARAFLTDLMLSSLPANDFSGRWDSERALTHPFWRAYPAIVNDEGREIEVEGVEVVEQVAEAEAAGGDGDGGMEAMMATNMIAMNLGLNI